jgi:TPR repeat protein
MKNLPEAVTLYSQAVQKDHELGMFNLAICYQFESSVKDLSKAIRYYKMAIDKKHHSESMFSLGSLYRDEPTVKYLPDAVKYYKMGSEKGHLDCMNNLGLSSPSIFL